MGKYLAADLFCGCGGMATGAINALVSREIPYEFVKSSFAA